MRDRMPEGVYVWPLLDQHWSFPFSPCAQAMTVCSVWYHGNDCRVGVIRVDESQHRVNARFPRFNHFGVVLLQIRCLLNQYSLLSTIRKPIFRKEKLKTRTLQASKRMFCSYKINSSWRVHVWSIQTFRCAVLWPWLPRCHSSLFIVDTNQITFPIRYGLPFKFEIYLQLM